LAVTLLDDDLSATVECRLITVGRRTGQPREIRIWFGAVGDRLTPDFRARVR
jgi:hypothetical protein